VEVQVIEVVVGKKYNEPNGPLVASVEIEFASLRLCAYDPARTKTAHL